MGTALRMGGAVEKVIGGVAVVDDRARVAGRAHRCLEGFDTRLGCTAIRVNSLVVTGCAPNAWWCAPGAGLIGMDDRFLYRGGPSTR